MRSIRVSGLLIVIMLLNLQLGVAQEHSSQNQTQLTSQSVEENKSDTETQNPMTGMWRIEAERTNRANRETRKNMDSKTIDRINSLTMKLNSDGTFEQAIGTEHKITGTWDFNYVETDQNQNSSKPSGKLTLVPNNLESHADMHFNIVFLENDLIEAYPPRGVSKVYFKKDVQESARSSGDQSKKTSEQKNDDRAAKAFADVPGCLGARSMEKDGVQISFVWFEDRESLIGWCKSRKHMATATQIMKMAGDGLEMREPLSSAPDEEGPFLVIMTLKPKKNPNQGFPLEQLSMEIYKPVDGGMFIGKRFAPEKLEVTGIREISTDK